MEYKITEHFIEENPDLLDLIDKLYSNDVVKEKLKTFNKKHTISFDFRKNNINKKSYLKILNDLSYIYEIKEEDIEIGILDLFYSYMIYLLSTYLNSKLLNKLKLFFKEDKLSLFIFFLLYTKGYDIVAVFISEGNFLFISNEAFLKGLNSGLFSGGTFVLRFTDVVSYNDTLKNEIYTLFDKIYNPEYSEIKIKKEKGNLKMLEGSLEFDSSNTKYVDLEKKFAHAEITSKIYKNKTKIYKVKELTKLNNKDKDD